MPFDQTQDRFANMKKLEAYFEKLPSEELDMLDWGSCIFFHACKLSKIETVRLVPTRLERAKVANWLGIDYKTADDELFFGDDNLTPIEVVSLLRSIRGDY